MPSEWPQRAYGKLVESPGGPIRGPDYGPTGRSKVFPEVGTVAAPAALGIFDRERWDEYPQAWAKGGLFVRPVTTKDGVVYLLASRLRARRENPAEPNSRYFVEIRHAIHPVESLAFAELFQLPDRLEAESLIEQDPELPPLILDGSAPIALPDNWFEQCRDFLVSVVAGAVLHRRDHENPMEKFYEPALWAIACLPGAIRWRIPIAAGVYALPQADKSPVRYALTLTYKAGDNASGDVAAGEAYARWFAESTEQGKLCETVQDILDHVKDKFPGLTPWDALPIANRGEVAVAVLSELERLEQLDNWMKKPSGQPPAIKDFVHLKSDVLARVAKLLGSPGETLGQLLPEVIGPEWHLAWASLAEQQGGDFPFLAVGQLLGTLSPLDPVEIAKSLDQKPFNLPTSLHKDVHSRLSATLEATASSVKLAPWEGLLRRAFSSETPTWFSAWAKGIQSELAWFAVRLRFQESIDVTSSWNAQKFPGAPAAIQSLLQLKSPSLSDFARLCEALPDDGKNLLPLLDHIVAKLPEEAIRLAMAGRATVWLNPRLKPEAMLPAPNDWVRAVACVAKEQLPLSEAFAKGLLNVWERLTETEQRPIQSRLGQFLGYLDSILFGSSPKLAADRPPSPWVWPFATELCQKHTQRRKNILAAANNQPDLAYADMDFRKRLLNPVLESKDLETVAPKNSLTLQFVLSIRTSRPHDYPEALENRDLFAAKLWLALPKPQVVSSKAPPLKKLSQFPIAALYLDQFRGSASIDHTFWCEWVRMIADQQCRVFYMPYVKLIGREAADFWRFANGWDALHKTDRLPGSVLTREEEKLILSDKELFGAYLAAVLQGAPLTERICRNIYDDHVRSVCTTPEATRSLYEKCIDYGDYLLALPFWRNCIKKMSLPSCDQIKSKLLANTGMKLVNRVAKTIGMSRDPDDDWYRLAIDIYMRSTPMNQSYMKADLKRYGSAREE